MPHVIHKYFIDREKVSLVEMPSNADVLSVGVSLDSVTNTMEPCIWAMHNIETKTKTVRKIEIYWTGEEIPNGRRRFLGRVELRGFIYHVFEVLD